MDFQGRPAAYLYCFVPLLIFREVP
jgi:hypothetical protein